MPQIMKEDKEKLFKIFSKDRVYTKEEHSVLLLLINDENIGLTTFHIILDLIEKMYEMHDENTSEYVSFLDDLKKGYS